MKTPAPEVLPAVEAVMVERVATAEPVSIETTQDEAAELEINIVTSAFAGKNHNFLNLACVSLYPLLNPKLFYKGSHESCSSSDVSA